MQIASLLKSSRHSTLLIHSAIGLLIGYFVLHPISMTIYWYEMNQEPFTWIKLGTVIVTSFAHSFSGHMMPMAFAFAVLGLIVGYVSGEYYSSIRKKEVKIYSKRMLLNQSIPTMISNGENEFVEFIPSLRYDYRQVKTIKNIEFEVLKSIAGSLNAKGGTIILGVSKDGQVLGLANDYWTLKKKDKDGYHKKLITLIANAFGKNICTNIHVAFHSIGDKEICTVLIEPSKQPVYLLENNTTVFFLRTGNLTSTLSTSETVEYLNSRL